MRSTKSSLNSTLQAQKIGDFCYSLVKELFPICRSLTGEGVRQTLAIINRHLPNLSITEIASGTQVFDWTVPEEWTIRDAYVADLAGVRIIDFKAHNLHVVGYSIPVDQWLDLEELDKHLYSLPDLANAIPYVTSYYTRRWGFCLTHEQRTKLKPGYYRAVIDAQLTPGVLNYGELIIPGKSKQEILLSTYICHPSMANNELSGPAVTTALALWLMSLKNRHYTYRIVFIPETIGSLVYLSRNLAQMKERTVAGFNITCIGDDRCYSFLPSRQGNTLADQAAEHVLKHIAPDFKKYTWQDRGSDERQYCAPGIDLPVATIMRSKYGQYPEYHTSLDNLSLVTPSGLAGGFNALKQAIKAIENNYRLKTNILGEPHLSKRGLYPSLGTREASTKVKTMMNLISYCDDTLLLDIAEIINEPIAKLLKILKPLVANGLIQATMTAQN